MMSKWIGSVKSISLQEPTKKKPLFCSELLFSANWTHKNTTVVSRNFPLSRSTENRPLGTDKHQKTNLLLQPEQLQNAPKISCATSLREREGDLRMRSLFASNHQSSRTDAIKSCPNIATDPRSLYPGPHPHLSLKLLFLLYEFHCSSGVLYLLVSIRRRALLVGGRRGGIGMVMSWKQHLVRSSRLLLNAAARRTTIHEVLFFSFLFVRSVFVSSCVLCQSEFANSCSSRCFVSIASCLCGSMDLHWFKQRPRYEPPFLCCWSMFFFCTPFTCKVSSLSGVPDPSLLSSIGKGVCTSVICVCVCVCMSFEHSIYLKSWSCHMSTIHIFLNVRSTEGDYLVPKTQYKTEVLGCTCSKKKWSWNKVEV